MALKCDLLTSSAQSSVQASALRIAREHDVEFYATSAKTAEGVLAAFHGMARPAPPTSSDFPLFPSTCSSLPLVFGCSDVAC